MTDNLTWQVSSLEWSKKLKELGCKQEGSLYCWSDHTIPPTLWREDALFEKYKGDYKNVYSAYTCSELGEMLPQIVKLKGINYQLFLTVGLDKQWFVVYANENDYEDNAPFPFMMYHNEADARSAMICHLLQQGIIKL